MNNISPDFIQHLSNQLNDKQKLGSVLDACQRPLRKSIRANLLKITADDLRSLFEEQGFNLQPIPWCAEGFWVDESAKPLPDDLGNWLPHIQGLFYIQEASSMLPVRALLHGLNTESLDLLLDMAAAPGSKTTQLAADLHNSSTILANELSSSRLKGLHHNIQRCGVINTCLSHTDGRQFGDTTPQCFDAILLDAPCGGEGTVRKDQTALADWSLSSVQQMSEIQKELIISAYKALKPGGRLVYSTCTLSNEENQDVCSHLLSKYPNAVEVVALDSLFPSAPDATTEEGYLHIYPDTYDCEGFFVACFEKIALNEQKTSEHLPSTKPKKFEPLSSEEYEQVNQYCELFGWDIPPLKTHLFIKSGKHQQQEVWYLPTDSATLSEQLRLNKAGIKIIDISKHGLKLTHQACVAFSKDMTQQVIPLTSMQAVEYLQGKDIFLEQPIEVPKHKEFIVTYSDNALGLIKHLGKKLKNNLPRDLVRDKAFS